MMKLQKNYTENTRKQTSKSKSALKREILQKITELGKHIESAWTPEKKRLEYLEKQSELFLKLNKSGIS